MKKNNLISYLRAEIDFPIREMGVIIHQPTYEEIGYIGEYSLYFFLQILDLTVESLYACGIEKNEKTSELSDFDVLLYFISNDTEVRNCFFSMTKILFPSYELTIKEERISFIYLKDTSIIGELKKDNYETFRAICRSIFPIGKKESTNLDNISTTGKIGEEIKRKMLERQKRIAKERNEKGNGDVEVDVFGKYCIILATGLPIDYEVIKKRTIFTIQSMFIAFMDKREYETFVQLKLAGCSNDIKVVDDWIGKIIKTTFKEEKE